MTPQTPIIDRTFKGVGRIKRATGTTLPKMREALSRMLTALHQQGRLDVLRSIRDGKLDLLAVYDAYRRHAVDTLPIAETLNPLEDAMRAWIATADASDKHRASLGQSLKYFLVASPTARVMDLPAILEGLRNTLGLKHPRSFNLARAAALAFVRSTLKRNHPLWAAVGAVEQRKVRQGRNGVPLTPVQLRNWFPAPETNPVDRIAWDMARTGMGEGEFWGEWSVDADRVTIHGTKRRGRMRFVPLTVAPAVPTMHPRTFTNKLRERTNRAIQPYDLRRTFANWLEAAGIPRTRRNIYRGHGTKDVGDLYERHEVAAFLLEDAEKIRRYLNLPPTKAHPMRKRLRAI